jgi:hypothetical protein
VFDLCSDEGDNRDADAGQAHCSRIQHHVSGIASAGAQFTAAGVQPDMQDQQGTDAVRQPAVKPEPTEAGPSTRVRPPGCSPKSMQQPASEHCVRDKTAGNQHVQATERLRADPFESEAAYHFAAFFAAGPALSEQPRAAPDSHRSNTAPQTSAALETAVPAENNITSTSQAQLQQPEPEIPPNDSNMNEGGEDFPDHVSVSSDGDSVSGGECSSEEESDPEEESEIEAQVDALLGGYEVKSPEVSDDDGFDFLDLDEDSDDGGDDDDEEYVPDAPSVSCPATLPRLHSCAVDLLPSTLAIAEPSY